jgi:peptidoglycan/LPS O-acetylase OafA/YrhL
MPRFRGSWILEGFGAWGVSLFFVLSAFLLADHFWRAPPQNGLKNFYVRRVFRIVPAYYINITILFLFFANHTLLFSKFGAKQVGYNFAFLHYLTPDTSSSLNVNGALWTLTIEAMLYLFMPLLAIFTRATKGWGVLIIIGIGLAYRLYVAISGASLQKLYFDSGFDTSVARLYLARQFIGLLPLFGLGIGMKWILLKRPTLTQLKTPKFLPASLTLTTLLIPSVLALVWVERASFYNHWVWFTGWHFLIGVLFLPALIVAARPISTDTETGIFDRGLRWVGERSYGLYLWHFPIILSVYGRGPFEAAANVNPWMPKMLLILGLSLAAAALSWKLVEEPAQSFARRITSGSRFTKST